MTGRANAMLSNHAVFGVVPLESFGGRNLQNPTPNIAERSRRPGYPGDNSADWSADASFPTVDITPHRAVIRRGIEWSGMRVELVQAKMRERVDHSFRSRLHLLAAYQQGVRRDGESCVEGAARSRLRDVTKKLTFVPAGHLYREWYDPKIPTTVTYFYFDPVSLRIDSGDNLADILFEPRLFFEDATIWSTASKLRQAIDGSGGASQPYLEALGVVLVHELARLNRGASQLEATVRGGLATWQRRIVAAHIEEHLSEQIPLTTLARIARLSTFHFCRAFKQSFGVPPHRYHTNRRIEHAKLMLAERKHSVTEIGLSVGFSETSSFTAVFRKITGQTPSHYHRALG
jgi:AraC family transcriptional regulator